jgi:WD40 repeat protein
VSAGHAVLAQQDDARLLHRLTDLPGPVERVAVRGDGKSLAVVCSPPAERQQNERSREVQVWDTESGKQISRFALPPLPSRVLAVAFSSEGATVATAHTAVPRSGDSRAPLDLYAVEVRVWNAETGEQGGAQTLRGHERRVVAAAFAPDGKRIVTGSVDRTIRAWDIESGEALKTISGLRAMPDSPLRLVIDPDGRWIGSANFNDTRGVVKIWDAKSYEHHKTWQVTGTFLSGLAFRADGKQLVTSGPVRKTPSIAGGDRGPVVRLDLKLWDVAGGKLEQTISMDPPERVTVRNAPLYSPIVSPDGKQVAAVSVPRGILIWDAATGKLSTELKPPGRTREIRFGPQAAWVVSVGEGPDADTGEVLLWRIAQRAGE